MAFSGLQITRQGLAGIPRGLYGDFSGKAIPPVFVPEYISPFSISYAKTSHSISYAKTSHSISYGRDPMSSLERDTVILGRDQFVEIKIIWTNGDTFSMFDKVEVNIGGETYDTVADPLNVVVFSDDLMGFNIGALTSLSAGEYCVDIEGYNSTYTNGKPLNISTANKLEPVKVRAVC